MGPVFQKRLVVTLLDGDHQQSMFFDLNRSDGEIAGAFDSVDQEISQCAPVTAQGLFGRLLTALRALPECVLDPTQSVVAVNADNNVPPTGVGEADRRAQQFGSLLAIVDRNKRLALDG